MSDNSDRRREKMTIPPKIKRIVTSPADGGQPTATMEKWMSSVTSLLDTLADSCGLEVDRGELIDSYNEIFDATWTTEFVMKGKPSMSEDDKTAPLSATSAKMIERPSWIAEMAAVQAERSRLEKQMLELSGQHKAAVDRISALLNQKDKWIESLLAEAGHD